jgi:hypothetical protein
MRKAGNGAKNAHLRLRQARVQKAQKMAKKCVEARTKGFEKRNRGVGGG